MGNREPIKEHQSCIREDKSIWKLAEYLHRNVTWSRFSVSFEWQDEGFRNHMYDKAAELLKRIGPNGVFDS